MEVMAGYEDDYFDLAVVDPEYGIGASNMNLGKWGGSRLKKKNWDDKVPDDKYFTELKRVSKNQIIWGGNYFKNIWPTRGYIVWDKGAGFKGRSFAESELAFTSFDRNAKTFSYDPLAHGDYKGKIHKTQKPIALYNWIYANYAKEGQKILDTHGGSFSNAIAAHYAKMEFVGCELDEDYYKAAIERIRKETRQLELF
jgi:site-specific DNA-methyltransferase (adenine-specific)